MPKRLREPVNGLTHLFAALASAIGMVGLIIVGRDNAFKLISLLVYATSLVFMFSASATYHLVQGGARLGRILRKLDHTSIYLLIAGTYTPICLHFFTGFWQWGIVTIIWTLAAVGIAVKLFMMNAPRWVSAGTYLLMGWLCLIAVQEMLSVMPVGALVWLALGGIAFTIGAVIYVTKKPDFFPGTFGFHEVWHIFVILGCLCHFILIAAFVAMPASV